MIAQSGLLRIKDFSHDFAGCISFILCISLESLKAINLYSQPYLLTILFFLTLKARPWQQLDGNKRADPDGIYGAQGTSPKYQVPVRSESSKLLRIQPCQHAERCGPNVQWVEPPFCHWYCILGAVCGGQLEEESLSKPGFTDTLVQHFSFLIMVFAAFCEDWDSNEG